jgi:hypothetical protein
MVIANPIYDTAFKGLIRDPDVAKTLIGTLLETEVLDVELGVTEYNKPLKTEDKLPCSSRLDYCATIMNNKGGKQKILIEIQKATGPEIILRFREYLAIAGYMPKPEEKGLLPIVTIYFLGFELKNIATPCLKVARQYVDMIENKVLEAKEKFVELLTHDSFIIQIPRIKTVEDPKTELEQILSIFEQKDFIDDKEITINYKYPVVDGNMKKMIDILHYIGTDPEERKKMDNEAYWRRYEEYGSGLILKLQDEIAEKDKSLAESAKSIAEKDKRFVEIAKSMKRDGASAEKISKLTGLTSGEIGLL